MSKTKLRNGGWQANIKYFENYVIKTPKTKEQIRKKISKHYKNKNELEVKIKKLKIDWKNSIKIIKSGKVPLNLVAYPEFIEGGKIKQKRVEMLEEEFNKFMKNKNFKKTKKLVDKVIDFIITLWSYGVHEITFKFYTEMGLLDGKIVLVDIGELTDSKELVKKQLLKGNKKLEDLRQHHHDKVLDYYQDQIKKRLTVNLLDKVWKSRIN